MRPQARPEILSSPRQRGAAVIETAIVLPCFLLLLLFPLEYCRALYVFAACQEATRSIARMASVTRFNDPAAMKAVVEQALAGGTGKAEVPLSGGIGAAHVRIDYLGIGARGVVGAVSTAGHTPEKNFTACAQVPAAANCIRLVRVRLCRPGVAACEAPKYVPLVPGLAWSAGIVEVPKSTTMTPAESLGARYPCTGC